MTGNPRECLQDPYRPDGSSQQPRPQPARSPLKQGEALLLSAQAMLAEARVTGAGSPEPLRIAFKAQSTAHFMPEVEAALRRQAPDLEVRPAPPRNACTWSPPVTAAGSPPPPP